MFYFYYKFECMSNIMCVYIYTISSSLFDTSCEALSVDVECIVLCLSGSGIFTTTVVLFCFCVDSDLSRQIQHIAHEPIVIPRKHTSPTLHMIGKKTFHNGHVPMTPVFVNFKIINTICTTPTAPIPPFDADDLFAMIFV